MKRFVIKSMAPVLVATIMNSSLAISPVVASDLNSSPAPTKVAQTLAFSGLWAGQASLFQDGKKISDCTQAFLQFNHSETVLETVQGLFDCSPFRIRSKPKQVKIQDGFLFYNSQLVGVIGDHDIFSSYWDPYVGWNHQFRLQQREGVLRYYEMVTLANGYEYYHIEGLLQKQSP